MITKKAAHPVAKPVVLIAEELSPATLEALGPDFEVRHCDGANRAELLPALSCWGRCGFDSLCNQNGC